MSDLQDLYRELIIDHGRRPRNFSCLDDATHIKEGYNPLCGDKITIYLDIENNRVNNITFKGSGCAISMASASMMTELLKGKTLDEAERIFETFHELVTTGHAIEDDIDHIGKLKVLSGVSQFPARVKCATLSWHTLLAALQNNPEAVSTE